MNQEASMDDLVNSLGDIYGVSELSIKENMNKKATCPVLVAENALVFFAWEFDSSMNTLRDK